MSCARHTYDAAQQIFQGNAVAWFQISLDGFWTDSRHLQRSIEIVWVAEEDVPGDLTVHTDRLHFAQDRCARALEHKPILPQS